MDQLADAAYGWSPYRYGYNNPVNFEDFDGMVPEQGNNTDPTKLNGQRINMSNAPAGSKVNAAGHARNGPWFWRQMLDQHPEMFSDENKVKIRRGTPAPTIDDQWIKYNSTHAEYKGAKLVHHHIDQGNLATGIPQEAHLKYNKDLHPNRGGRLKGGLGKIGNELSLTTLAFDIFSSDPHVLGMQFTAGNKLNTVYFDNDSKQYFEVTGRSDIKDGKGNVTGQKVTYTTYEDYQFNQTLGRYEGVNKIDTYEVIKYEGQAAIQYIQQLY